MDAVAGVMGTMFVISNALLYPVIIVLLALIEWALVSAGQFIS
jgi:type IV secretory pathway VirB3-like protein